MPRWLPVVNKRVVNRVLGVLAQRIPPWAILTHTGRKSGTRYKCPVIAIRSGVTFVVPLAYGDRTDWVRNVLATGGAELNRAGTIIHLGSPRVLERGADEVPWILRLPPGKFRVLLLTVS